jgi:predicted alpha/beta-fold hydrolase
MRPAASGTASPALDFVPAWFLRSPHLQTLWGRLARPRGAMALRREVLITPDDDELVLDHLDAPASPLHFILLHGLEGSSNSVYIQGLLSVIARHGFAATAMNFRSCARDPRHLSRMLPNRQPRFYHSGETTDFDFVLRTLAAREPEVTFVAAGASLGGNQLLKWLGEHPGQNLLYAAAAMSVPFDLAAGGAYLETGIGPIYVERFLKTLRPKVRAVWKQFPEVRQKIDFEKTMRARTFREFDDAATAPLHGMRDADDYYTSCSSIYFLDRIDTPALVLTALDDPFVPPPVPQRARQAASAAIDFRVTAHGGHVGFVSGSAPWNCRYWAEELIVNWLAKAANERQSLAS